MDDLLVLVDLLLDGADDQDVAVDDKVHDRIQAIVLAVFEQRRCRLAAVPHGAIRCRCSVPNGDDVTLAGKDVRFAVESFVAGKLRGPQNEEQRAVMDVDLRPLMGTERVINGEFVQAELPLQAGQNLGVWLV